MNTPSTVASAAAVLKLLAKSGATGTACARPAVVSHYNVQPVIDVYASAQGRDLGGVADDTVQNLEDVRQKLPRGTQLRLSRSG